MLREKYKIDPVFAQKVDEQYGPLDWRLPEAHAIYWGAVGLEKAKKNPDKVKSTDLITLRRIIYQSMLQAFHHGRIIDDPFSQNLLAGAEPGFGRQGQRRLRNADDAEDLEYSDHIGNAYRNFLKDAVYFLYENDRVADAAKWYKVLGEKYPDKTHSGQRPEFIPAKSHAG